MKLDYILAPHLIYAVTDLYSEMIAEYRIAFLDCWHPSNVTSHKFITLLFDTNSSLLEAKPLHKGQKTTTITRKPILSPCLVYKAGHRIYCTALLTASHLARMQNPFGFAVSWYSFSSYLLYHFPQLSRLITRYPFVLKLLYSLGGFPGFCSSIPWLFSTPEDALLVLTLMHCRVSSTTLMLSHLQRRRIARKFSLSIPGACTDCVKSASYTCALPY